MDQVTEELTSLEKRFYGLVIGRQGSGIREIKYQTGATVKIRSKHYFMIEHRYGKK